MVVHSGVAFARWLMDAMRRQIPVIYFRGTSPGRYQPIIPAFIVGWRHERLRAELAFGALVGASAHAVPPEGPSAGKGYANPVWMIPHQANALEMTRSRDSNLDRAKRTGRSSSARMMRAAASCP
jgi:hypothetical protein